MFLAHVAAVDKDALEAEFERLGVEGRERLSAESVPAEQMSLQRLVDMRYVGQWRSLTVAVSAPVDLDEAVDRFHAEHERAYNYRRDDAPVEIYRLSVRAAGVTPKPQLKRHESTGERGEPKGSRPVHFDASADAVDTPCVVRSELAAGTELEGPAIIDQLDSTPVVPPGWQAEVDEWLNIRMKRKHA